VAAVSRTIADVIHVGVELVVISLRLATEMSRRSRRIEPAPGFWGHTLIGLSPKDIKASLEEFHHAKVGRSHTFACIPNSLTKQRLFRPIEAHILEYKDKPGLPSSGLLLP